MIAHVLEWIVYVVIFRAHSFWQRMHVSKVVLESL